MAESYDVAAIRHYSDALVLKEGRRLANSDQLFGFAAECGIKLALLGIGGGSGKLGEKFWEHINLLWDRAPVQSFQRRFPGLFQVIRSQAKPFSDWAVSQRYGPDDAITEEAVERHHQAAKRVLGSVGLIGRRRQL